jgi:hypothetical protein
MMPDYVEIKAFTSRRRTTHKLFMFKGTKSSGLLDPQSPCWLCDYSSLKEIVETLMSQRCASSDGGGLSASLAFLAFSLSFPLSSIY